MSVEFNASQERLAGLVVQELDKTEEPFVLYACGFTGTGKNTVLSELEGEIQIRNGQHVSTDFLLNPDNLQVIDDTLTRFVTSGTPRMLESVKKLLVDQMGFMMIGVNVKTMTMEEAISYIERARQTYGFARTSQDLGNQELAALTMGIYRHLNRYFELKKEGEFYQPTNIRDDLRSDLPEGAATGSQLNLYMEQLSNIPQLWMRMGLRRS